MIYNKQVICIFIDFFFFLSRVTSYSTYFLSFTRNAENGEAEHYQHIIASYRSRCTGTGTRTISDLCGSFVQDWVWRCRENSQRRGASVWSALLKYNSKRRTQNINHKQTQARGSPHQFKINLHRSQPPPPPPFALHPAPGLS